jgi:hypothetical protein
MRVLHRLHALHHERAIPVLAQERKVFPRPEFPRVRLPQPLVAELLRRHRLLVARCELLAERLEVEREGGAFVRPHWEAQALHEDRIRCADLRADRCCKRQIGGLEVVWAPADNDGVEGDDERGEARRLGAAQY